MNNMSPFKLVIMGVFAGAGLIGFLVFGLSRGGGSRGGGGATQAVEVWGTLPASVMGEMLVAIKDKKIARGSNVVMKYKEFSAESLEDVLLKSIVDGTNPDVIIAEDAFLWKIERYVVHIPFENYPERTFRDNFVEAGESFFGIDGIIALPLAVNPLVLYWNRDIFATAGVPEPPRYWDELFGLAERMTIFDSQGKIVQSAVGLGEYRNIKNAKGILSALILQGHNPIVSWDGAVYESTLGTVAINRSHKTAESALRFYVEFANPLKTAYTWNRAMPEDQFAFLSGDLAMYLGYASDAFVLRGKNPNLNFDVAQLPQVRDERRQRTYGQSIGVAVIKNARNFNGAFSATYLLTGTELSNYLSFFSGMPSARRDVLASGSTDTFMEVFFKSALIARGWHDIDAKASDGVFGTIIEDALSGTYSVTDALKRADRAMQVLYK